MHGSDRVYGVSFRGCPRWHATPPAHARTRIGPPHQPPPHPPRTGTTARVSPNHSNHAAKCTFTPTTPHACKTVSWFPAVPIRGGPALTVVASPNGGGTPLRLGDNPTPSPVRHTTARRADTGLLCCRWQPWHVGGTCGCPPPFHEEKISHRAPRAVTAAGRPARIATAQHTEHGAINLQLAGGGDPATAHRRRPWCGAAHARHATTIGGDALARLNAEAILPAMAQATGHTPRTRRSPRCLHRRARLLEFANTNAAHVCRARVPSADGAPAQARQDNSPLCRDIKIFVMA